MGSSKSALAALVLILGVTSALAQAPDAAPARRPRTTQTNWWSEAGGENGPPRTVWAAQKTPETPYNGVNKPIWHIADILKAHQGRPRCQCSECRSAGKKSATGAQGKLRKG